MSNTNKNPTTSSYITRAGATLPGPPQPACDREGGCATPGLVLPPNPPLPRAGSTRGRAKRAGQTRGTHGRAGVHENVIKQSSRVLPSKAGYVHRGDWRTPPPGRSNAWDAGGGFGTYNLRECYKGHTPSRTPTASISGRGAATLPGISILQNSSGARKAGAGARHTGPRRPPASGHGCVTPSPARHAGRNVPAPPQPS